jgi:hypothetical protein
MFISAGYNHPALKEALKEVLTRPENQVSSTS